MNAGRRRRWLAAAGLALATTTGGAEPASRPPAATGPWNVTVGRPAPVEGRAPEDPLRLHVYEGFNTLGPLYGHRNGEIGVDVTAAFVRCRDGALRVSQLDVGGWRFDLDGGCAGEGAAVDPPQRIRCDPTTWHCRSMPSP